jgi:hypothetical protein
MRVMKKSVQNVKVVRKDSNSTVSRFSSKSKTDVYDKVQDGLGFFMTVL